MNLADESPFVLEQVIMRLVDDLSESMKRANPDMTVEDAARAAADRLKLHLNVAHGCTPEAPYGRRAEG